MIDAMLSFPLNIVTLLVAVFVLHMALAWIAGDLRGERR